MNPKDWPQVRLGDLGTWYGGGTPSKSRPDFWSHGTMPWLSPKDMGPDTLRGTRDAITIAAVAGSAVRLVPAGSVAVVVRSGILERTLPISLVPFETTLNQDMKALVPTADVDARWVTWGLRSMEQRLLRECRKAGTTVASIDMSRFMDVTLPLPPIEEQRGIVGILEDHLSRLDAAERELDGAAGRLARLRDQVVRHALFPSSPMTTPSAVPLPDLGVNDGEIPDLPNDWRWARLGELSEVVGGVTKDSSKQGDPTFVEVPYLRVANVQRGRLDLDVITKIRVPPGKAAKLELLPGDVLLNEGGDRDKLGRGWVWDGQIEHCIHQNHVFRARIRDGVLTPKLLSWAANSFGGRWCERNAKQSVNLASISLSKIRLMPVPVPPLQEQAAIEREIQSGLDGCDQLAASISAARRESRALRASLLNAAFSGHLTSVDIERVQERAGV